MTTTRLPSPDYNLTIRRAIISKWQREWENILVSYIILNHTSKNEKIPTIVVGNARSNLARYGLDIPD